MVKLTEQNALYRVAAYCSKAERCEYDVRKKLVAWELSEEEQSRIIKRLKDEKYLDNSRYCRSYINDKVKYNKWGEKKIIFEFRKKMIAEKDYLPHLEDITKDDFEEQLIHILKVKNRTTKAKDDYDCKTKLMRFALGRGFQMDLVIKCVDNLLMGKYDEEDF